MDDAKTLTLRIRTLDELFTAPQRDPWRDGPEPAASGVTRAVLSCAEKRARHFEEIAIEVEDARSDASAGGASIERVPAAWKNHCLALAAEYRAATAARRSTGWRAVLQLAPVIAAVLALSAFFDHAEPLPLFINRLFSEGFIVLGWVMLWRPIELLLFDAGESKLRERVLKKLAALPVKVTASGGGAGS